MIYFITIFILSLLNNSMNIIKIDINDLYISPLNIRKNIHEDNILVDNIRINGLLNPLTVQYNEINKKYEIIAGQRRFMSLQKLDYKYIPCNVIENKSNDELQIISLIENIQRKNMKLIDKIKAYNKIYNSFNEEKMIQTVKYTGSKKSTIDKYIKVKDLSDEILNRLDLRDDDGITLDVACRLVEIKNSNIYICDEDLINILNEISYTTNNDKVNILTKYIKNSTGSQIYKISKERNDLKKKLYENIEKLKDYNEIIQNINNLKKIINTEKKIIKYKIITDPKNGGNFDEKINELDEELNKLEKIKKNIKINFPEDPSPEDPSPEDIYINIENYKCRNPELQKEFRIGLIKRYNTCIITDMDEEVCEAAHIIPFNKSENFDINNGILLNCILHKLFDKYLFSINPETLCIEVSDRGLQYEMLSNNKNKKIQKLELYNETIDNIKNHYSIFIINN